MIIWLNGPFGAGKTALAQKLRERKPDLLLFDPEEIGFIVKTIVPPAPSGDYQDLPLWRGMTAAALAEIRKHYRQDIIVPMTLVRPDYLDELLGGLRQRGEDVLHVFLTVDERTLRQRIERQTMSPDHTRNEQIRDWRLAQVDRCLAAREAMPDRTRFLDTGLHNPDILADTVLEWLGATRSRLSR
ncbi:AAA family ATPase [Microvirga rosea]|uniref:AAA family ATPase n=1 Tax=Microvirga rosea TaxID=2715425 RepID=UPI001D0B3F7A|nr:AAA family ATPase [Microvirga rosea]MCB8822805.1 AAA family ATPase [Microvirga rosea]